MKFLNKTTGVIVISFLLFMYFDTHDVPGIVTWIMATMMGAIATGLEIVERYNNAR